MLESILADNPLILKHVRSRLRRQDLIAPVAVVLILAVFITWLYISVGNKEKVPLLTCLVMMQGVIIFLMGTSRVANAITEARDSAIIDFHRISPLTPAATSIGFLLGAPIREWLLAACIVPFEMFAVSRGEMKPEGFVLVLGSMVVCGLLYHLLALVVGLIAPRPRLALSIPLVLLFFHEVVMVGGPAGYFTVAPAYMLAMKWTLGYTALGQITQDLVGFGGRGMDYHFEYHFMMSLVHQLILIVFLLIGAARAMRKERAYFCSKAGGLLFFGIAAVLLGSDVQAFDIEPQSRAWCLLYSLTALAMALCLTVTPDNRDFAKGVRRAARAQLNRVPLWVDTSPNWAPLMGSIFIVAVGCEYAALLTCLEPTVLSAFHRALSVALTALFAFASARQGFELRFGRRNKSYFALLLLAVWFVPLLIGVVMSGTHQSESPAILLLGICPWAAMSITAVYESATGIGLVVVHCALALCALYWRWTTEQVATRAALAVTA